MRTLSFALVCLGSCGAVESCRASPKAPEEPRSQTTDNESKSAASLVAVADSPMACVEAAAASPGPKGPPKLISVEAFEGGPIELKFSEPVRPTRGFDPNQFRLSGLAFAPNERVLAYSTDSLVDALEDVQDFSFRRMDQPAHDTVRLWPAHRLPEEFCAYIDQDPNERLALHFAAGPGAILDLDGERLREIAPHFASSNATALSAVGWATPAPEPLAMTVACKTAKPKRKPPICQTAPPSFEEKKRPQIIAAKLDVDSTKTLTLTFSEAVAPTQDFDPKQFRLSAWDQTLSTHHDAAEVVKPDDSRCQYDDEEQEGYLFEECIHDWDWADQRWDVVRMRAIDPTHLKLSLTDKFGPSACADLKDAREEPSDGLYLHFRDLPTQGIETPDGRRLADIDEPWVRIAPLQMEITVGGHGRPNAFPIKCDG